MVYYLLLMRHINYVKKVFHLTLIDLHFIVSTTFEINSAVKVIYHIT